jgi:hypothetical protein
MMRLLVEPSDLYVVKTPFALTTRQEFNQLNGMGKFHEAGF